MSCLRKKLVCLPLTKTGRGRLRDNFNIWCFRNILFALIFSAAAVISGYSQTVYTTKEQGNKVSALAIQLYYQHINSSAFPEIVSFVNVTDDGGLMIGGRTKDNFEVHEDEVFEFPIEVIEITEDVESVSVALALDRSGSMRESNSFDDVKNAASNFIRLLQNQDQAAVISFCYRVTVDQPFTSDKDLLIDAIFQLADSSGTHIFDAVMEAANLIEFQPGRRAIILLTDGKDKGNGKYLFQAALNRIVEIGVPVITIGLGLTPGSPEENVLIDLANGSGGLYFASPTSEDLQSIYAAIASLLHNQYKIIYTTHNPTTDGTLRHVRIDVQHQGMASQDTSSYRAPNHIVTIAPTSTSTLSPGLDFGLNIEIPSTSKYLYHRMQNLNMTLKYDPTYLKVKQPYGQTIVAGSLFGDNTTHTMNFNVDENNGLITFTLNKKTGFELIEGRGQLAHIDFETDNNLSDNTQLKFEIVDHLATDENDWPIATQVQDLILASYGLIVWPGDTNKNGTVELTDVTVLGVYWDIIGPGRPTEPDLLAWKPQLSGRYPVIAAAHADADGEGIINERDIVPIGLNWGKTTLSVTALAKRSAPAPASAPAGNLRMELSGTNEPGKYLLHLIYDCPQASRISGTTFRLFYPAGNLTVTAARAGKAWPAQPLFISSPGKNSGEIAVGVMLTADSPALKNGGELAEIVIQSENIPNLAQFKIENVGLVSTDGVIHEVAVDNHSPEVTLIIPSQFILYPAYPNPFNPGTVLRYALPEAGEVAVLIYNVTGRLVLTSLQQRAEAGEFDWKWDGRDQKGQIVSTGVYFVRFEANALNGQTWRGQQKITLMK